MPKFSRGADGVWRNAYGEAEEPPVRGITPGHPPAGHSSTLSEGQQAGLRFSFGKHMAGIESKRDLDKAGLTFDTNRGISLKPVKPRIGETFARAKAAAESLPDTKYAKEKGLKLTETDGEFSYVKPEPTMPVADEPSATVTVRSLEARAKEKARQKAEERMSGR